MCMCILIYGHRGGGGAHWSTRVNPPDPCLTLPAGCSPEALLSDGFTRRKCRVSPILWHLLAFLSFDCL